jgi:FkbM family methyltransferase
MAAVTAPQRPPVRKTIFDLGLHKGQDAEFYLRKGFRVVGVDANPDMCALASERLASHVHSGELIILNRAIAEQPGEIEFFKNQRSEWGTANPRWAARNDRLGSPTVERIAVRAVTLADLVGEFGVPYFVKIDIEGMDVAALRSLSASASKPKYISIESEKVSFSELREEFATFQELGYDKFKIVAQHRLSKQKAPQPSREGEYVDQRFEWGSSGLFGEEAPGEWLSAEEAINAYKTIFLKYYAVGDDPLIRSRILRALLSRLLGPAGWYDTHARLRSG